MVFVSFTAGSRELKTPTEVWYSGRFLRLWTLLSLSLRYEANNSVVTNRCTTVILWCEIKQFFVIRNLLQRNMKTRNGLLSLKVWVHKTLSCHKLWFKKNEMWINNLNHIFCLKIILWIVWQIILFLECGPSVWQH